MSENGSQHIRAWLLEAELEQLRNPPHDVAQHLNECIACRSALQRITRGHQELDSGLEQLVRPRTRRWLWAPLPLAAAAVIALLLLPREQPPRGPSPILAQLMFPDEPVVTPPEGKQAIVMEKNELTVVWLTDFRGNQ